MSDPRTNNSSGAATASSGEEVVHCSAVTKAYRTGGREVPALRGVDLAINGPGFFAIMGPSGSGKSTLLHLLAALDTPDSGTVRVAGEDLSTKSDTELTLFRRKRIGIVFQQFNLIPTLTAEQNVQLPGMLAGDDERDLKKRSDELLTLLGLGARTGHRPDALSGGEQQRVAIARALLYKPRILFADEPTGNLDSASSVRLWTLLKQVAAEQSLTIVMVTHEPAAAAHCHEVFVLRDGAVVGRFDSEGLDASGVAARYQQLVQ